MKQWKIPVIWSVYGYVEVGAETIEDALTIAIDREQNGDGFNIPTDHNYVEDSFYIDEDPEIISAINLDN